MLRAAVFLFLCPGALGGKAKCSKLKNFYKDNKCCGLSEKEIATDSLCGETLDEIYERDYLKCGVKDSQPGMGYFDPDANEYSGLDISYCQAINAALGLKQPIEYVVASASNRFDLLNNKDIDVLIRTTTWTTERDVEKGCDFAAINFFDGQSLLVNQESFESIDVMLAGNKTKVCVESGTTSEGNVDDFFAMKDVAFEKVVVESSSHADQSFQNKICDAITGDMSALVAKKYMFEKQNSTDFKMWISEEQFSKEPLASATRDHDVKLNEIVKWVWYAMITAEEMAINSTNYKDVSETACKVDGGNPAKCRFLNDNLGLGSAAHPLSDTWVQDILETVGNYKEAYENAFCDEDGCIIERSGWNRLVDDGGIMFAPPMRR